MTAVDVAALLEPVSEDAPCGPSVEYDDRFIELEKAARGVAREEDANGKVIREAQPPDWPEAERAALELCAKSKDLRVAIYLARARLALDGLPGFGEGLDLIGGYLKDFWPSVHPQLDAADDNDPSIRVNTLVALCHNETVLRELRLAPLTQSRQFGRISLRDCAVAAGTIPPPPVRSGDERLPDSSRIEAAFADTPIEVLEQFRNAAAAALERLGAIDGTLTEHLGAGNGPDFTPLEKQIGEIKGVLDKEVEKRGGSAVAAPADGETETAAQASRPSGSVMGSGGPVRSRDDVLLLLDRICRYYSDYEPSSPVPLILNRTKRLVTMNFLDILKDLTPGGVQEFGVIAGIKAEEEE